MMARCDNLGAATGGEGAPLGVLMVSFARSGLNPTIPTAQDVATATGVSTPEDARQTDRSVVFRTKGAAPSPNLSPTHWRSGSKVGQFTMGASLVGPEGRRVVSGIVRGTVRAERVEIAPGARVEADVETPALLIEEGGHFQGRCKMEILPVSE